MNQAERRYQTPDAELLAIVKAFKKWRHYLEGSRYPIIVKTDHANLRYFMTTKQLSRRQADWAQDLAAYDFYIEYRTGKTNPADGPSRRPDYKPVDCRSEDVLLPTLHQKLKMRKQIQEQHSPIGAGIQGKTSMTGEGQRNTVESTAASQQNVFATSGIEPLQADKADPLRHNETIELQNPHLGESQEFPGEEPTNLRRMDEASGSIEGSGGLRHLIPRVLVVLAAASENPYDDSPPPLLDLLKSLQKDDVFVQMGIWSKAGVKQSEGWRIDSEGLLRRKGAAYVPKDMAVRDEIMKMNHDDPYGGHFGPARTTELIRRKYFWPGLRRDIKKYVHGCDICQRTKALKHKPYGELQPLPLPLRPWKDISMDFITGLPPCNAGRRKAYDAILVVVDRYTKMAKYTPVCKTIDAADLANIFHDTIVMTFGPPTSIVTDRGSLFTSHFWSSLCFYMKARRRLSTAFHPQTDGQTERQNQTLEHYLRCYANYRQDDWVKYLPMAEFTYNNLEHSSTGMTPFYVLYGYHPEFSWDVSMDPPGGEVPSAKERIEALLEERSLLEERWQQAVEYQAKAYNAKHIPKHYAMGDYVLLSAKNIKTNRPSKKLDHRFLGPFQIIGIVGKQAYKLVLLLLYKVIHLVFHVSLLELY
jgi:transposase InsO family protein